MENISRLFFAIEVGDQTRDLLIDLITQLQQERWSRYIRWTRSENLHITLRFIGRCKPEQIADLIGHTKKSVKTINSFNIHLNSVRLFPSKRNPHVLSVDINPSTAFFHLADVIEQLVVANEFTPEQRAYLPHLTLGRPTHNLNHFHPQFPVVNADMMVNKITLLHSDIVDNKRLYLPIAEFNLCSLENSAS